MNVLVVDDEAPARQRLVRMLGRVPTVDTIGQAEDGVVARQRLTTERWDAVLLDIHMPEIDGITLVELVPEIPPVIFTTAHDQHAVRAFELAAVDYLLKPIRQARLEQALARVDPTSASRLASLHHHLHPDAPPRLVARTGHSLRLLDPATLTRLYAADKYTLVQVDGAELILEPSLRQLEKQLQPYGFMRVHRAELINLAAVQAIHGAGGETEVELSDGQRARVSRRLRAALEQRLGITAAGTTSV